jgi:hypothetical protein
MSGKIVYQCTRCEKVHEGLPAITFDAPYYYYLLTESERAARATLTDDFCIIDDEDFFVRVVLKIPVIGHAQYLEWGVWGTLSRANFERYRASFHEHDQSKLDPMFSWFASHLPDYQETLNLQCNLVARDDRLRPFIDFAHDDAHALVLDWKNGITLERAIEFVAPVLHKH